MDDADGEGAAFGPQLTDKAPSPGLQAKGRSQNGFARVGRTLTGDSKSSQSSHKTATSLRAPGTPVGKKPSNASVSRKLSDRAPMTMEISDRPVGPLPSLKPGGGKTVPELLAKMDVCNAKLLATMQSAVKRPKAELEFAQVMDDTRILLKQLLQDTQQQKDRLDMMLRLGDADSMEKVRQYCTNTVLSPVCDHRRVACLKEVEKVQTVAHGWFESAARTAKDEASSSSQVEAQVEAQTSVGSLASLSKVRQLIKKGTDASLMSFNKAMEIVTSFRGTATANKEDARRSDFSDISLIEAAAVAKVNSKSTGDRGLSLAFDHVARQDMNDLADLVVTNEDLDLVVTKEDLDRLQNQYVPEDEHERDLAWNRAALVSGIGALCGSVLLLFAIGLSGLLVAVLSAVGGAGFGELVRVFRVKQVEALAAQGEGRRVTIV